MANHILTILSKPRRNDENRTPYQGVVKHDWVPTGRIDFATHLNGNASEETDQPNEFKLLIEERRVVESIAGNENLEIQWRLATLREAKAVVTHYHKYMSENSLFKNVLEETITVPSSKEGSIAISRVQKKKAEQRLSTPDVNKSASASEDQQTVGPKVEKQDQE